MTFSYAQSKGALYHLVRKLVSIDIYCEGKKPFINQMIFSPASSKNTHKNLVCADFEHGTCDTFATIYRVGHADTCWPGSGWFWIRFRFITRALSHYRDNRPCFNRSYGLSDRRVFFHVDRTIDGAVPNRRFVGPVHHVYLDLNCPRQHSVPPVLSNGFQSVALSLGVNKKVRMLVTNVEISKSSTVETTMKYTS